MNSDYSLHDAWIESVTVGPRREIYLSLALGSARISDPRLPKAATLRLGKIANFDVVSAFFTRFEPEPVARIDGIRVMSRSGSVFTISVVIDPQGTVEIVCGRLELLPVAEV